MTPVAYTDEDNSGLDFREVLLALIRHKWKVIICTVAGLMAAGVAYYTAAGMYQSEAKLLIKYVVEKSPYDRVDSQASPSGRSGEGLIDAEIAIISSWDLVREVAKVIGPDRLLAGTDTPPTPDAAAGVILKGLDVRTSKESSVISVTYENGDPQLATEVLGEIVRQYFDKHLAVHRSVQAIEFVIQAARYTQKRTPRRGDDVEKTAGSKSALMFRWLKPRRHCRFKLPGSRMN